MGEGWFVAESDENPKRWSIFLETGTGIIPSLGLEFMTYSAAERWMLRHVAGKGRLGEGG